MGIKTIWQKQFKPEDTKAGPIQSFLDNYNGTQVFSKLIHAEALNHPFDEPKQWEIREINEIMSNRKTDEKLCISLRFLYTERKSGKLDTRPIGAYNKI